MLNSAIELFLDISSIVYRLYNLYTMGQSDSSATRGAMDPPKYLCNYGSQGPLYRQGVPTAKEFIHTRGPCRQKTPTDDV